jgi:N-acetylglucosamine-6-phosphate deacetylase
MEQYFGGKIILPEQVLEQGTLVIKDGIIADIIQGILPETGDSPDNWILPGFIDVHLHGLGEGSPSSRDAIVKMSEFAPSTGVTSFCPTMGPLDLPELLEFVENVRFLMENQPEGATIAGSHLEGPYISSERPGGMDLRLLRKSDIIEAKQILASAQGSLKIISLAPEIIGAEHLIKCFSGEGVRVSAGHTVCPADFFSAKVDAGVSHVCHLFDTFDGREVRGGVSVPCLADEILIEDRVTIELIMDGIHVPPSLIKLALRAAGPDRIVAITDAMQGAGLTDGEYSMADGRRFSLKNGDVCRLVEKPEAIVGSCLTMNRAFINMIEKFGFTPVEASKALSANPARVLGLEDKTGSLKKGFDADIAVLSPDGEVLSCMVKGRELWNCSQ